MYILFVLIGLILMLYTIHVILSGSTYSRGYRDYKVGERVAYDIVEYLIIIAPKLFIRPKFRNPEYVVIKNVPTNFVVDDNRLYIYCSYYSYKMKTYVYTIHYGYKRRSLITYLGENTRNVLEKDLMFLVTDELRNKRIVNILGKTK